MDEGSRGSAFSLCWLDFLVHLLNSKEFTSSKLEFKIIRILVCAGENLSNLHFYNRSSSNGWDYNKFMLSSVFFLLDD